MKTLKLIILTLMVLTFIPSNGQNKYVLYNASDGVILHSAEFGDIVSPKRGTKLSVHDKLELKDKRYFVKVKDSTNGEIYSFEGKRIISPSEIVNLQTYSFYKKFWSFLLSQMDESGFNTTPVHTDHCVTHKGGDTNVLDSISTYVASNIASSIENGIYFNEVVVKKEFINSESFNYVIINKDTCRYAFAIYTVGREGIYKHNQTIILEENEPRPMDIEYIPLGKQAAIKLDYFSMATMDEKDNRTCYILLFDFYEKDESDRYIRPYNWDIIEKELKYQGDVDRVLYIK